MSCTVPQSAEKVAEAVGRITDPRSTWPEGSTASAYLYRGVASKGYRSNYERVPHAWLYIRVHGPNENPGPGAKFTPDGTPIGGRLYSRTYSYSGRCIGGAEREFDAAREFIGLKVAR